MTDDKMPPRNRYSRRFASKAAPVKQAKIAVEPRNANMTILQKPITEEPKLWHIVRQVCFEERITELTH